MTTETDPEATCTRAETAAMLGVSVRTVARMVKRGDLTTAFTPTGARRILRASVIAAREGDTNGGQGADLSDSVPVTQYAQLAAAYGALAQSVDAYLVAGIMGRRSAKSALRTARATGAAFLPPPAPAENNTRPALSPPTESL